MYVDLYKNFTPNSDNTEHYLFTNINDYWNACGTPFMTFDVTNYTLNNNVLKLKTTYVADMRDITYVAQGNQDDVTFYFVDRVEWQSGYAILHLSVDLWATYISNCTISKIRVNRCNRNIGNGVYDPIPVTSGREFTELKNTLFQTFSVDDLAIVYVVAFATGVSSVLVNNAGSYIGVFANNVSALEPATIDNAIALVGGIYSAAATIGDLDAAVLKAYLLPKQVLGIRTGTVPVFNTKTPNFNGTLTPAYECAPLIFPVAFDMPIDPNNKYFVGTKLNGLEIDRTTQNATVTYNFIVKQDSVQVIVNQGNKQLDITESFQVGLTNNDGNITASQRIARVLQTMTGIAGGYFQVAAGGAGLVTGFSSMTNAIQNVVQQGNAKYTAGGDGVTTYRNLAGNVQSPFYMQTNNSIDDEQANARLYGAVFNQQLETLNSVFDFPYLINGEQQTYIAANCAVDGIPTNARDFIRNELQSGIYLKRV